MEKLQGPIVVYIVNDQAEYIEMMKASAESIKLFSPNCEFHVVVAEDHYAESIPSYFTQHLFKLTTRYREREGKFDRMNNMSYIKLWLPDIFKNYEKILHIDVDTLCYNPIEPIWNLNPKYIAAHALANAARGRLEDCHLKLGDLYHIGGLLVMNTKNLLNDDFKGKVLKGINEIQVKHGWCHEETLMNINYKDKIETIPLNYQILVSKNLQRLQYHQYEPLKRNIDDTIIYHFDGPSKRNDVFEAAKRTPKDYKKFLTIQNLKRKLPLSEFFKPEIKNVWIPKREGFNKRYIPYLTVTLKKNVVERLEDAQCVVWHGNRIVETDLVDENGRNVIDAIIEKELPIITTEDSFIYNVLPAVDKNKLADESDRQHLGLTFNNILHFESQFEPDIVKMLESDWSLTREQRLHSIALIKQIIDAEISKYNSQIVKFYNIIPRELQGNKLCLVVDQVYGDQSIIGANATPATFKNMLITAANDNPYHAIVVKTHPVSKIGKRTAFFTNEVIKDVENQIKRKIFCITGSVNPISLLKSVDKVYVVSSGLGLESILLKKKVVTFGCPFYSGFGLTDDRNPKAKKRKRKLTVEELFYKVYLEWTHWMDPISGKKMTIEEVINRIIKRRNQIFRP